TPGQWSQVRIELFPVAHVFRPGSRIRLIVSGPGGGSNGWPWAYQSLPGGFDVRIGHDEQHASSLVLPVVEPRNLALPASLPDPESVTLQPTRPI
ncbi:MAG TPA: CocE/NonD family hydrolase C-terminal non-catalytic domain-containing protein, partial [Caulifigura sp.]|nr:CocE/NonD family hydrolase C-terminal non-catalytic domain-containing protein [Caulifigura sp.]